MGKSTACAAGCDAVPVPQGSPRGVHLLPARCPGACTGATDPSPCLSYSPPCTILSDVCPGALVPAKIDTSSLLRSRTAVLLCGYEDSQMHGSEGLSWCRLRSAKRAPKQASAEGWPPTPARCATCTSARAVAPGGVTTTVTNPPLAPCRFTPCLIGFPDLIRIHNDPATGCRGIQATS